ncbi:MAG: T9SS type A sorting domain-containing protein [Bacteroidota bacterium]
MRIFRFPLLWVAVFLPILSIAQDPQYLLPAVETCSEETLIVEVRTNQFTDVASVQFSIQWDTAHLHFDTILKPNPVLLLPLFNTNLIEEGRMAFSWLDDSSEGVDLPSGAVLFELHFQAKALGGIDAPLSFVTFPSPLETVKNINGALAVVPSTGIDGAYRIYRPKSAAVDVQPSNNGMDGSIDLTVEGGKTPYTFAWSNGASSEDIQGLSPFAYFCTVTDDFACQSILGPFVVDLTINTNELLVSELKLWPNPVQEELQLQAAFSQGQQGKVRLYDVQGTLLQVFRFQGQNWEQKMDFSVYPSGLYWLDIQIGRRSIYRKVLKIPH